MLLPYTNIMHPCCFVWSSDEITNVLFLLLAYKYFLSQLLSYSCCLLVEAAQTSVMLVNYYPPTTAASSRCCYSTAVIHAICPLPFLGRKPELV